MKDPASGWDPAPRPHARARAANDTRPGAEAFGDVESVRAKRREPLDNRFTNS